MFSFALVLVGLGGQLGPTPPPPPAPKLVSTDVMVGKGDQVEFGDVLSVDYTGKLANGKVFDTSKKPGRGPFTVVIGIGRVIKGWDQGLIGMRAGGVRKLVVPPELAYGSKSIPGEKPGDPPTIPANSTLTFTVAVNRVDHAMKRMKIEITKAGTGLPSELGDTTVVKFSCKTSDGNVFFSTEKSPDGAPFKPGVDNFIPGFTLSVIGMKTGEKRTVTVPPELAFGATGQPQIKVKPNEPITFDIELVSLDSAKHMSGGKEKRQ